MTVSAPHIQVMQQTAQCCFPDCKEKPKFVIIDMKEGVILASACDFRHLADKMKETKDHKNKRLVCTIEEAIQYIT